MSVKNINVEVCLKYLTVPTLQFMYGQESHPSAHGLHKGPDLLLRNLSPVLSECIDN